MWKILRLPVDDYLAGLERAAGSGAMRTIPLVILSAVAAWWVYVPIHELLHAFGCIGAGGEVTRLEIAPIYGAALLQRWFPFIAVGSDYAGQLTGFDTHGSDVVYLATDLAPFLLTIFPGVTLLRSAGRATTALSAALRLGAAIPIAFAPFISLTGDFYESGSIVVSRAWILAEPGFDVARWRSDDLLLLIEELPATWTPVDAIGIATAVFVGTALAFAVYALGHHLDRRLFG